MRMTATQADKKAFVDRSLAPMLAGATDGRVSRCRYGAWRDDEWVDVDVERPPLEPLEVRVSVSQRGKWDIAWDVLEALDEHIG